MKTLIDIFAELAGLFIDDDRLALGICVVVALAAIVAAIGPAVPIAAGIVLMIGCLGMLCSSVMTAVKR